MFETNPLFLEYLQRYGLEAETIVKQIRVQGHLKNVRNIPPELGRLFVTALEVPVEQHLQIQAAFQRHVDNSVSKTINLPTESTAQDVADAYYRAWQLGLKGITVYRSGSKSAQVLELGADEEAYHYEHSARCDPEECKV
jgi:ribonucleoside-diphosphate reductase alpha chain